MSYRPLAHLVEVRTGEFPMNDIAASDDVVMPETFVLEIDYTQSLEDMIAAGGYCWVNPNISARKFVLLGEGTLQFEAKLFPARPISPEKAIEEMEKAGWLPANIEHLLAFGKKFPQEQRKYSIISLAASTVVDGTRRVPDLSRHDPGRGLHLRARDSEWLKCSFLAVRELPAA